MLSKVFVICVLVVTVRQTNCGTYTSIHIVIHVVTKHIRP